MESQRNVAYCKKQK